MQSTRKTLNTNIGLLTVAISVASLAPAMPANRHSEDTRTPQASQEVGARLGKVETLTGTISMVKPEQGIVVVIRRGPSEPASTQLTITRPVAANTTGGTDERVTVSNGPGETDYSFRVTSKTLIQSGEQRVSLASLVALQNKEVTVYFVPERSGNYALGIEAG